jgi:hypothetical protein
MAAHRCRRCRRPAFGSDPPPGSTRPTRISARSAVARSIRPIGHATQRLIGNFTASLERGPSPTSRALSAAGGVDPTDGLLPAVPSRPVLSTPSISRPAEGPGPSFRTRFWP